MVGVFFMADTFTVPGLTDQSIHVFDTNTEAQEFIFNKLVDAGEIEIDDSDFVVGENRFDSRDDAVEAVRDGFGMMEYFHIYDAVDHRKVTSA